jgi:hypothetical protein
MKHPEFDQMVALAERLRLELDSSDRKNLIGSQIIPDKSANRLFTTVASPHKFRGYDGGEQRGATCQNRYRLRCGQYCRTTFAHQGLTGAQPLH